MKLFLLIIGCSALVVAEPSLKDQWNSFKVAHGKKYSSIDEENFRFSIFKKNMKNIEEHNAKYAKGEVTYDLQINKFGDMSPEEFSAKFNGFKMDKSNPSRSSNRKLTHTINANLPDTVDWRKKGAVTPVKNQANCNGCWSFSTTGAMEGQLFLKRGRLVALSEQQLLDCSWPQGNNGCDGGLMEYAFKYIQQAGGLMSEGSYPFLGMDGRCMFSKSSVVNGTQITSYVEVAAGDEGALKAAVATAGPVAVAVASSSPDFMFYHSGILTKEGCGTKLTHAVLVVGYGSESNHDYWIVKNSWSTNWGENGYMKLARNQGNACGVATYASYPVLEGTNNEGTTTVAPAPTTQQTTTTSKPPSSKAWKVVLSSWHLLFICIFFSYFSINI